MRNTSLGRDYALDRETIRLMIAVENAIDELLLHGGLDSARLNELAMVAVELADERVDLEERWV